MNEPNEELHEKLALYALDALEADEKAEVEKALSTDAGLWQLVDSYRAGLADLTETTNTAPDHVWDNIAAAIGFGETADSPTLQAVPSPESPAETLVGGAAARPIDTGRLYPSPRQWMWQAAAAAAIFALVGFGVGRISSGPADPLLEAAAMVQDQSGSVVVELVADGINAEIVLSEEGEGYLVSDNLTALPASRTYQLWAVTEGGVTSAGVLGSDPGIVAFHTAKASEVQALVITEENAGGVVTSEGTVIAAWGV